MLWSQRNQNYDHKFKHPQLEEIVRRARVTVIMYDENQVLHKGQVCSHYYMDKMRDLAKSQGPDPKNGKTNYYVLKNQSRMTCSEDTMIWIDEAGSTFTIQGFDLAYVGVIIGPSVKYDKEKNEIVFDEKERKMNYMVGRVQLDDGTEVQVSDLISMHELRVLMTRGTKGLLIYACDPELRKALKGSLVTS